MSEREGVREPPIHVEPEGVKPELRKSGHRWLDLSIAISAILLSLISLAVAIGNARTQEKMVAASTWPLLQFESTNVDADGQSRLRLQVTNAGVGPALLETVRISYRGRPASHWPGLLMACCGWSREINAVVQRQPSGAVISSSPSEAIIRPGESLTLISFLRTPENEAVWRALDKAVWELKFDACYCSVFEECWRSDLASLKPQRVARCEPAPDAYR